MRRFCALSSNTYQRPKKTTYVPTTLLCSNLLTIQEDISENILKEKCACLYLHLTLTHLSRISTVVLCINLVSVEIIGYFMVGWWLI